MSYSSAVLADNPTAYWQMNETSGTTITDTINSYVLTAAGTPFINQPSPVDRSINTNNGGGAYTAAGAANLRWALDTDLCIEFIHQRGNLSTNTSGLLGHRTSSSADQHYAIFYIGGFLVLDVPSSSFRWTPNVSANDLFWHHYVFNHFGPTGNRELWIDGVLRSSTSAISKPTSATAVSGTFSIGNVAGQGATAGNLDEVAIYNGATLSSSQIQAHWRELLNSNTKNFLFASL